MFKIRTVDAPFRSAPPARVGEVTVGGGVAAGAEESGQRGAAQGLLAAAQDPRLFLLGR